MPVAGARCGLLRPHCHRVLVEQQRLPKRAGKGEERAGQGEVFRTPMVAETFLLSVGQPVNFSTAGPQHFLLFFLSFVDSKLVLEVAVGIAIAMDSRNGSCFRFL